MNSTTNIHDISEMFCPPSEGPSNPILQHLPAALSILNSSLAMQPLKPIVERGSERLVRNITDLTPLSVSQSVNHLLGADSKEEFTPLDALSKTMNLSLMIACYGVFVAGIPFFPVAIENWHAGLLLGLWWSASTLVEFVCYDFFRSALAKTPHPESPLAKWLPAYKHHPELEWAFHHNKKCFVFCTAMILATYAIVSKNTPGYLPLFLNQTGVCSPVDSSLIQCAAKHLGL